METKTTLETKSEEVTLKMAALIWVMFLIGLASAVGTAHSYSRESWLQDIEEECTCPACLEICMSANYLAIRDATDVSSIPVFLVSAGAVWYLACFVDFGVWLSKRYRRFRGKSDEILRK